MLRIEANKTILRLDEILHSLECICLSKNNTLVLFFPESITQPKVESFIRSFHLNVRRNGERIFLSTLINLWGEERPIEANGHGQIFLPIFCKLTKGDVINIHLCENRGLDFTL